MLLVTTVAFSGVAHAQASVQIHPMVKFGPIYEIEELYQVDSILKYKNSAGQTVMGLEFYSGWENGPDKKIVIYKLHRDEVTDTVISVSEIPLFYRGDNELWTYPSNVSEISLIYELGDFLSRKREVIWEESQSLVKSQAYFDGLALIEYSKLDKLDKVCDDCEVIISDSEGRVTTRASIHSEIKNCDKKIIITDYSYEGFSGKIVVTSVVVLYKLQGEYWYYDKSFSSEARPKIKKILAASMRPVNISPF